MTLTSFDLVSDNDGSVVTTSNDTGYQSAVVNSINYIGFSLRTNMNENGVLECELVNSHTNEVEKEFVSYSQEAAEIEALSLLGYSIFESLTEAELFSLNANKDDFDEEEFDELIEHNEQIEEGKILAFAFEL
jgi:hypothetical protein